MFSVSIEQRVLATALKYLQPTVGKNSTQLGDNCISMQTTGNGSIKLYTTNTIEFTELEAIVAVGGNTTEQAPLVDFARFKAIIDSIPENEYISLEANVNDLLINFAQKKVPVKLTGCTNGMIPLPGGFGSSAVTIPKDYIHSVTENVCNIITDDMSAPIYNCMRVWTNGNSVETSALDMKGRRMFVQTGLCTGNNPTTEILIEASKMKKSLKIFEDYNEIEFYVSQGAIKICPIDPKGGLQGASTMIANIAYYTRIINGAYPPNINNHFYPQPTEFSEINKDEIMKCIMRVKAVEDKTLNGTIGFRIDGNNAVVTLNSAYGNLEDNITTENTITKPIGTVFKYEHLSDIMKAIGTDSFEIGVLPNHPTNFIIKAKGSTDVMFTLPGMVGSATP